MDSGGEIQLKPLRERRDDVELLIAHFLARFAEELNAPSPKLSSEAHKALMAYEYPGNIASSKALLNAP